MMTHYVYVYIHMYVCNCNKNSMKQYLLLLHVMHYNIFYTLQF